MRKKVIGFRLQIIGILLMVLTITYHLQPIPSLAQDSSPSGSLLDKLNQLKTEIASKAAQIKSEVNKKVQDKAIIGTILNIDATEITLQTLNSEKQVKVDEFTEVIGLKNKKIKLETLEARDSIAAIGDMDDKNNLVARRLVFLENFATSSGELIWGQIQKSTGSTITVKTKEGETKNISTNSQTQFFLGNEEASIADSKVEKHLVSRATRLRDGSLRARFIYFIPSSGFTKPTEKSSPIPKTATPSASAKR